MPLSVVTNLPTDVKILLLDVPALPPPVRSVSELAVSLYAPDNPGVSVIDPVLAAALSVIELFVAVILPPMAMLPVVAVSDTVPELVIVSFTAIPPAVVERVSEARFSTADKVIAPVAVISIACAVNGELAAVMTAAPVLAI